MTQGPSTGKRRSGADGYAQWKRHATGTVATAAASRVSVNSEATAATHPFISVAEAGQEGFNHFERCGTSR